MNKADIRKLYLNKRKEIGAAEKNKLEDLILIQFQKMPITIPSVIMSYTAIEKFNEFDPQLIVDYCRFREPNQTLLYPVMQPATNTLKAVATAEETIFEPNVQGVYEPTTGETFPSNQIEMVLIPLLAFDKKGYRVGYGKGYYDRFLENCKKDVLKIGFSFFEPIENIADTGAHDVQLDFCVTAHHYYSF